VLTSRFIARVGALLAIGWGLAFLLTPEARFVSPAYDVPFAWIHQDAWGWIFLAAGLLALVVARAEPWALLVALYTGWATSQVMGFALGKTTPLGWLLWVGLDFLFLMSLWRYERSTT
jgi:hypothetical protein